LASLEKNGCPYVAAADHHAGMPAATANQVTDSNMCWFV
jgi:hypothetical protein